MANLIRWLVMRPSLSMLLALLGVLQLYVPVARAADPPPPAAAPAAATPAAAAAKSGLSLHCTPNDADIFIDGDSVGKSPIAQVLPLAVGEHTIRVSRPGYAPYIDVFRVKEGQVAKLEVEIVPISGVLHLTSSTAVRVFVDEKYVGEAPIDSELTVGAHKVRVERGGFYPESFAVSAVAGQVIEKAVDLKPLPADQNPYLQKAPPPQKWYQKWWVWTIGAVGVAAVATAIIVPVVLSRKDVCDGLDVCVQNVGTTAQGVQSLGITLRY